MKFWNNIYVWFIAGIFLTSCSNEISHSETLLPSSEEGARLEIKLGSLRTRGHNPIEILAGEAEIQSVACFVRIPDSGKVGDPDYKQGTFLSYFITEDEKIVDNQDGTFSVTLRIQSPHFTGKTDLAVIANFRENGLTAALESVEHWEDLFTLTSAEVTTQGITMPLLMLGYKEVTLVGSGTVREDLSLKRLVARIDIENQAAQAAVNPFLLHSAEIIHPKAYTYIVEGNENTYDIPVRQEGFNKVLSEDQVHINGLYTYEAAGDGSVPHTALLIKGSLGGKSYSKRIELMQEGKPVPLLRNTRYCFLLKPTIEGVDIEWSLAISEWSEGTTIPVKPTFRPPVYQDIRFKNADDQDVTQNFWYADTKTAYLNILDEGYKITFVVENRQTTEPTLFLTQGSWQELGLVTEEDKERFIQKVGVIQENGIFWELYEITFPQQPAGNFEMEVRIENTIQPDFYDSLYLHYAPDYTCQLEDFLFQNESGGDVDPFYWNPQTRTYLIDHIQPYYKVYFSVRTIHGTTYTLTLSDQDKSDLGIHSVEDILFKYNTEAEGIYTREYYGLIFYQKPQGDVKAEIRISNAANPAYYDYILLDANHIIYPGTPIRAVRIGPLYWAPVNVGQTLLEAATPSAASTGSYFQWGRNNAFTQNPAPARVQGPVSLSNALEGTNKNQFIYGVSPAYDWLRTNTSEQYARNLLWSTPAHEPCPDGWRLPTQAELIRFRDARNGTVVGEHGKSRRYVTGDDGQRLYFPYMGNIRPNDGYVNAAAIYRDISLWAADTHQALHIHLDLSISVTQESPANGYGLRCVRQMED